MTQIERIVVVGASLAGLRAAEALRDGGYQGRLTLVGDEPHEPYDRPPLSKQVLSGWVKAHQTALPRMRPLDAEWRLGERAVALDRQAARVEIASGEQLAYDRLIIATGARARPWFAPQEAALLGVHVLRTQEDAARLCEDLDRSPRRVVVVGAGFTGSEVASVCRARGLAVTVVEMGNAPLLNVLGDVVAAHAAELHQRSGVDLRCGVSVARLHAGPHGRVSGVELSDGVHVEADVVVVCLGAVRNTDWLGGSGLDATPSGIACDEQGRVLSAQGQPVDDIFACGDVARVRSTLAEGAFVSLEHWGAAIEQAQVAAANILRPGSASNATLVPRFWSMQFGSNFKSVGLPSHGDEMMIVQGATARGQFVAAYGRRGRLVGVVAVNQAQWLAYYEDQLVQGAAFPPTYRVVDAAQTHPQPAGFPPQLVGA